MGAPCTANLPFERGQIFRQYDDDQNENTTAGAEFEGKEFMFDHVDLANASNGIAPPLSGRKVICRIVRNNSGAAILPKRFVKAKTDGTTPDVVIGQAAGYATAITDVILGVADEFLPAAGVPDGKLFWCVVDGPSQVTTDSAGDTNIPCGGAVIPATAGTAVQGVETAGAALAADITAAIALALRCPARALVAINATSSALHVNVNYPRI